MLSLQRIENGACYLSEEARKYVVWSMFCYASKMFWGCGIIKILDRVKLLSDQAFIKYEPGAFPELIELLQSIESPLLDAVRIVMCFENYFKAVLLLENYVIHRMDLNLCREHYPQFVNGKAQKQLLQKSTPILISDILQVENSDGWFPEPIKMLTTQTIDISTLLEQPKYRAIYSKGKESDDKLFPLLRFLKETRNSLHFLNIEYIACGLRADEFTFLRDYVSKHVDLYSESFYKCNEASINTGKAEIDSFDPEEI